MLRTYNHRNQKVHFISIEYIVTNEPQVSYVRTMSKESRKPFLTKSAIAKLCRICLSPLRSSWFLIFNSIEMLKDAVARMTFLWQPLPETPRLRIRFVRIFSHHDSKFCDKRKILIGSHLIPTDK